MTGEVIATICETMGTMSIGLFHRIRQSAETPGGERSSTLIACAQQQSIQSRKAKAPAAVQEIGNVRLCQPGLAGQQRTAEDSLVDAAPCLEPQALV